MGASAPEVRFDLANEGGCCVVQDRVARVDLGDGSVFTIHLAEIKGVYCTGRDVHVHVKVGRIIDFAGVGWNGAYPSITCSSEADAHALAFELLMGWIDGPVRMRERFQKLPNPFTEEANRLQGNE